MKLAAFLLITIFSVTGSAEAKKTVVRKPASVEQEIVQFTNTEDLQKLVQAINKVNNGSSGGGKVTDPAQIECTSSESDTFCTVTKLEFDDPDDTNETLVNDAAARFGNFCTAGKERRRCITGIGRHGLHDYGTVCVTKGKPCPAYKQ